MIRRLPSPVLPLLTALFTACSGGTGAPQGGDEAATDTSADTGPETPDSGADDGDPLVLFPMDHLLEVNVTLAPGDWTAIQAEAATWFDRYNGADCLDAPYAAPSTERSARVTVDGADAGTVGLRRNGDWRSESAARPSLKVNLDPDGDGRRFHGVGTMALENLAQDPGAVRLCAVYDAMAALGQPAPRCALAHVTVNGEDLGVYAHVEDADDALFPRVWGDDAQVYEGGDADFLAGWTGSFDPKNDTTDPKAPAVHALTDALATDPLLDDGAALVDAVGAVADLDALGQAWATEVLFEETAGYSAARGPMYAVVPADGLLRVVPWSPIVSLGASPSPSPLDLLAAQVPARLAVADPAGLPAALTAVLATWDGAAMAADVTRLADLARPAMTGDVDAFEASVAAAAAFVEGRRAVLEAALADGLPTPATEPPLSPCLV